MTGITTYRNERSYGFCPGCSHALVLDALNRALVRLQWDPARIVIVTDIGCVGLSDQYFITSGFHGLHGRSLTYASGIKLAHPDLHVINLIGDGGCGIGLTHLVNAARRNFDITTLVFNNLNFGMTGGEHSVTTPQHHRTATTPWGNTELPLNIAETAATNGATFVWRGTAFDKELDHQIAAALVHEGFAVLDIWELCVAYFAATNRIGPKQLQAMMDELGFAQGVIQQTSRLEGSTALRELCTSHAGEPLVVARPISVEFSADLDCPFAVVIAGGAGGHVRTAGRMLATAATASDLWATQRDDYPTTVRSGHSISEIVLSPTPVHYAGIEHPNALFVLAAEGFARAARDIRQMTTEDWLFVIPSLEQRITALENVRPRVHVVRLDQIKGVARSCISLAAVAAGMAYMGVIPIEALLGAASQINPAYAQANRQAVQQALDALRTLILPLS